MTKRNASLCIGVVGFLLVVLFRTFSPLSDQHNSFSQVASIGETQSGIDLLIIEPDDGIAPIIDAIDSASTSVDMVMYQLEDAQIEHALAADAARGVNVRVLLNEGYYGKKENPDNDAAYSYLSQHGVQVHWTSSYFALTHQKSFAIDGTKIYIMTMNFTPQYYSSGREFAVVDTDTKDVSAVETTFNADWQNERTDATNGDGLVWSPGSEEAMLSLINNAQTSLDIYNEEMADQDVTQALEDAAKRGVSVRITMTYSTSWKKAFQELSASGVLVHTYASSAPLYIHAKVIIADGERAFVGSENFSKNSLLKNRELGIILTDPAVIVALQKTFEKDFDSANVFN